MVAHATCVYINFSVVVVLFDLYSDDIGGGGGNAFVYSI